MVRPHPTAFVTKPIGVAQIETERKNKTIDGVFNVTNHVIGRYCGSKKSSKGQ